FLVTFASRPEISSDFTSDITRLKDKLLFKAADGMTAMYDSVYMGLDKLRDATNPKRALLLITDGEDNHSRYTYENVREFVKEQDVQIYGIGIVGDFNSQSSACASARVL